MPSSPRSRSTTRRWSGCVVSAPTGNSPALERDGACLQRRRDQGRRGRVRPGRPLGHSGAGHGSQGSACRPALLGFPPATDVRDVQGRPGRGAVRLVDPRNTSRTCPECGHIDRRNRPTRDEFRCVSCGLVGPVDYFAAINIGRRAVRHAADDAA
ncbi:zinc ribbon domain-containing protein [Streptosporangium sp. NPDC002544]|uniref:zinc ribbon domain-containing protein n=1 Tax=Streptosporangium sp. NPDC002544 TaxID=3154538 RepID=UPI00332DC484